VPQLEQSEKMVGLSVFNVEKVVLVERNIGNGMEMVYIYLIDAKGGEVQVTAFGPDNVAPKLYRASNTLLDGMAPLA
jgi:hypothetical protein